jgi:hypothetical protein
MVSMTTKTEVAPKAASPKPNAPKKEKNRFNKPVAFNRTVEEDQKILAHLEDKNFSGYVKELILRDINGEMPESTSQDMEYTGSLRIVSRSQNGGIKYVLSGNIGSPTSPLLESKGTKELG